MNKCHLFGPSKNLVGLMYLSCIWCLHASSQTPDSFNPSLIGFVNAGAVQPDGRILVGGQYKTLSTLPYRGLARFNVDGSLDTNFNPAVSPGVQSIAVDPNGQVLVAASGVNRFNTDGSIDSSFISSSSAQLLLQPDGKILSDWTRLVRLNNDGSLDTNFTSGVGSVFALAQQPDGKILVGGTFTSVAGQERNYLARLNSDGVLDTNFNPVFSDFVYALAVQPDGKILTGGGSVRRFNADGSLDNGFNANLHGALALCLTLQTDGKILAGGNYLLTRLNPDGSPDTTFNVPVSDVATWAVWSIVVQSDGRIVVGGSFSFLGGQNRSNIGRLINTGPVIRELSSDGSTITWMRGGVGPEVWRTVFAYSTNNVDWVNLGSGERIPGGWQITAVSVPTNATFSARGFVVSGRYSCSSWFVEQFLGPLSTNKPSLTVVESAGMPLLSITGDVGRPYAIEYAPTLATNSWGALATLLLTNNPQPFLDSSAPTAQRFYRVRLDQ